MAGVLIQQNAYAHTGSGELTVYGTLQADSGTTVTVEASAAEVLTLGAGTATVAADGTVQNWSVTISPTVGSWGFGSGYAAAVLLDENSAQLATATRLDLEILPVTP